MNIEEVKTQTIVITGAPALDPITVVFRDCGRSRGGIIVECYGRAWSAFWGAMGDMNIRGFLAACDAGYISTKLGSGAGRQTKAETEYLMRISEAVRFACLPNAH